jgi:hypothetical protein
LHDVFERAPEYEVVRNYRQWAFEAAALDLALRQAGLRFDEMVGRTPEPVHFVVSNRTGRVQRTKPRADLPTSPFEITPRVGFGTV